jgi:hypothetical protein
VATGITGLPEIPVGNRRNGATFSNQVKVLRAIELLRPVAASLAERCPAGWKPFEADIHKINVQEALARLAPVASRYER